MTVNVDGQMQREREEVEAECRRLLMMLFVFWWGFSLQGRNLNFTIDPRVQIFSSDPRSSMTLIFLVVFSLLLLQQTTTNAKQKAYLSSVCQQGWTRAERSWA
eukprot:scaffold1336_cov174-Amphora_coffeaeformis.AAC.3